jgi:hypothetical protein
MLNECTHIYNERPVKVMQYFDYFNAPLTAISNTQGEDYVLILDPQSGETLKVPASKLRPLGGVTLSIKAIARKNSKSKSKKEVKKVTKKKEVKKKKSIKKEDVVERIDNILEEGWFDDKKEELKLTLQQAYTGTVKFVKDLKTMSGEMFNVGKTFLAKKEANQKGVKLYKYATDPARNNPPMKVVPFDMLNNYIQLLGMKGLKDTMGPRMGWQESVEDNIENYLEEKEKKH